VVVGSVLAERRDEWGGGTRCANTCSLAKPTPATVVESQNPEEMTPQLMAS